MPPTPGLTILARSASSIVSPSTALGTPQGVLCGRAREPGAWPRRRGDRRLPQGSEGRAGPRSAGDGALPVTRSAEAAPDHDSPARPQARSGGEASLLPFSACVSARLCDASPGRRRRHPPRPAPPRPPQHRDDGGLHQGRGQGSASGAEEGPPARATPSPPSPYLNTYCEMSIDVRAPGAAACAPTSE